MTSDPWPEAPELPPPVIMGQRWKDAVFLHWRIPEAVAAAFMPPGVVPDIFDQSAWVGLIGFRMEGAGLGRSPGVPYLGSFNEINVRLYSREPDGTRGVVFLSLDASRLAVVLAARAAGIPYVWSRTRLLGATAGGAGRGSSGSHLRRAAGNAVSRTAGNAAGWSAGNAASRAAGNAAGWSAGNAASRAAGNAAGWSEGNAAGWSAGFAVSRFRDGGRSVFAVTPEAEAEATDPLSVHLTARFGLHTRFRGRTLYVPNSHSPWPLYRAKLTRLEDQLVAAAGISVAGPPDSVLFSPGVRTLFGWPRVVDRPTDHLP